MSKRASNQWDFGDLFSPQKLRRVLTVEELTGQVKKLLEQQVGLVWVTGEITNFRRQSSGHCYFSIKDASSQLSCVLFRGEPAEHRERLQDGVKVILQGQVTVYEARGQYQMIVKAVELQGVGALQQAFERLKLKLSAEGLFDAGRKRAVPAYPRAVGLVTSPTGAALRDVLHVTARRDPGLQFILAPCRVQGVGAAREIAQAIMALNVWAAERPGRLDAILVTRGGGSLEDLWAFNEEEVARAIGASVLPVISAVGHEIDFTISDFVADLRAATPSAAAEVLTQGMVAARELVGAAPARLSLLMRRHFAAASVDLQRARQSLTRLHPRRRLEDRHQRLDDLREELARIMQMRWKEAAGQVDDWVSRLRRLRLRDRLERGRMALTPWETRLRDRLDRVLQTKRQAAEQLADRLRLLSPERTLARGYSITTDAATGALVREPGQVRAGSRLATRVQHGTILSTVEAPEASDAAQKS